MFDASDTLLTTRSFPTLAVLDTVPDSFAVTLSTVGTYNIIAVADHSGLIVESDDTNNPTNAVQVTVNPQFPPAHLALAGFGTSNSAGGWFTDDQFPRELADVNRDGLADIVGLGIAGVTVALATGGGNFGPAILRLGQFGTSNSAGGWISDDRFPASWRT